MNINRIEKEFYRAADYESAALPLSYGGVKKTREYNTGGRKSWGFLQFPHESEYLVL
jgi:hypothetical protein